MPFLSDSHQAQERLWNRPEDVNFEELLCALLFCGYTGKRSFQISRSLAELARTEKGLFYLEPENIASLQGIGRARASAIVAATELARRQYSKKWPKAKKIDLKTLAQHLQIKLEGLGREYFYLFSFNRSFGLIQEHLLARGGSEAVNIYYRDILKTLLNDRASQTLIAHNHPDASALPSDADLISMRRLKNILEEIGIILLDQYIVGMDGVYSCKDSKLIIAS